VGTDAAIKPRYQAAPVQRCNRSQEGEHGKGDDQDDDARQDQHLDGIETHGAKRIDLLAHLHGAELGGVRAAGAAATMMATIKTPISRSTRMPTRSTE